MSSVCCVEKHHSHVYTAGSGKKSLREIEIPPRKLFSRRTKLPDPNPNHLFPDIVSDKNIAEDALLHKFLPCNTGNDDDDGSDDPYSSDDFRMYEFKVRRCMRSRSHDWTDCPFAHPGEKARRRDPRRFHYSGNVCTDFRRGGCRRGDSCEFAHGVFESWLHPARYRTQACKDGKNCKRKVCFFAHTPRQLRVLPLRTQATQNQISSCASNSPSSVSVTSPVALSRKYPTNHCCVFCHNTIASSPTSTLMGLSHLSPSSSPPLSPPISPERATFSPLSRFNNEYDSISLNQLFPGGLSHKNALAELVSSLEAMDLTTGGGNGSGIPISPSGCEDQFILSPSAPPQPQTGSASTGLRNSFMEDAIPDLEWVNELVM